MSKRSWPPFDHPAWRPLLDAIEFLCQRFSVKKVGAVLHDAWVSGDLLSLREKVVEGRVVREPLKCGKEFYFELSYSIDSPGKFSGSYDDILIELGLERLLP